MWSAFIELIRATIFAGSHLLNGSLGLSIVVVSTLVRLALLPLSLRTARLTRQHQARLATVQPELRRLQKRHAGDPAQLVARTRALYEEHGIPMLPKGSIISMAVQMPLLGGLFAAVRGGLGARVRFLWIADLTRFDAILVSAVVAMAGAASWVAPGAPATPGGRVAMLVAMGATLAFLWSASSAVALSVGAGSAVSILQSWLIRRDARSR